MTFLTRPAPHIRHADNIKISMADVLVALFPCGVMATIYNGVRFLILLGICIATAVICELILSLVFFKKQTVGDLSAVVTGAVTAMLLPATVPYTFGIIAPAVGIIIAKFLFGGVGKNMFNPALVGVALLTLTAPVKMSMLPFPLQNIPVTNTFGEGSVTFGTSVLSALKDSSPVNDDLLLMLVGHTAGAAGVTCIIVIFASMCYLLYRHIISTHITFSVLVTVTLIAIIFPRGDGALISVAYELMGGSLVFCSVFCATDPVSTPNTAYGKIFFGIGVGAITMLVRYFGEFDDGIIFAILIMNGLSFAMDKLVWNILPKGEKN